MKRSTYLYGLLSILALKTVPICRAQAVARAELTFVAKSQEKGLFPYWIFRLQAPRDEPIFYHVDRSTGLVIFETQVNQNGRWLTTQNDWTGEPQIVAVPAGGRAVIRVQVGKVQAPWRIGMRLYSVPEPTKNSLSQTIWSTSVEVR